MAKIRSKFESSDLPRLSGTNVKGAALSLDYQISPEGTGTDITVSPHVGAVGYWNTGEVTRSTYSVQRPRNRTTPPIAGINTVYARHIKRGLDILLGLVALVLALPVMLILMIALWFESGAPFYTQQRLGKNGKLFRMIKFRTMVQNADVHLNRFLANDPALKAEWESTQKLKHDPRITPIGRMLRKTSLDELPQILNVIKGDMSLVGPRPLLPDQITMYENPAAYLGLRPGISGLWQVTARNEASFDRRAELDQRYAEKLSFELDTRIFIATFRVVFKATGY